MEDKDRQTTHILQSRKKQDHSSELSASPAPSVKRGGNAHAEDLIEPVETAQIKSRPSTKQMIENPADLNLQDLLEQLSLKQKCQLVCGKDFWHSAEIPEFHIPSLTFSDGPHGLRYQADAADHLGMHRSLKSTCFPPASALACSWDENLARQIGSALGKEAAALGVDVLLGPGINLIRNPKGGRNFEYFSEDPLLTGKMASAMVQGIQKHVSACPKHFLLNSQETSRMTIDERADEDVLYELYLPAFERVIQQANPDWIMSSYNKIDGTYASESKKVYNLLEQLGFHGAVVTDWGGGNDIARAVSAGSSLEMPGTRGQSAHELYQSLLEGKVSLEDLDQRVLEILQAISRVQKRKEEDWRLASLGGRQKNNMEAREPSISHEQSSFHERASCEQPSCEQSSCEQPSMRHHHILAVQAAIQSSVLLQNNGILPLAPDQTIAWIGPFDSFPIQGGGSSQVEPSVSTSFSDLLARSKLKSAGMAQGYDVSQREGNPKLEKKAIKLASKADVVVFLSALPIQEQLEGIDRKQATLPNNQMALLQKLWKLNKPVVLVDAIAGPVEIMDVKRFAAILYMGLAGQGAPASLLKMLAGAQSPAGFLAQTFAQRWQDHPSSKTFPMPDGISSRPEKMMVGYRAFCNRPVLFPFGYGLSYTTFSYEKIHLHLPCGSKPEKSGAECSMDHGSPTASIGLDVCNTGSYTGSTLLQVYITKPGRDYKELAGFAKIQLKPKECKEVHVEIDPLAWRMYDTGLHGWKAADGIWKVELSLNAQKTLCFWDVLMQDGMLILTDSTALHAVHTKEKQAAARQEKIENESSSKDASFCLDSSFAKVPSSSQDSKPGESETAEPLDAVIEDSRQPGEDTERTKSKAHSSLESESGLSFKKLSMESALHEFADAKDPLIAWSARKLVKARDKSLAKNKANLVLISLADMPPKGLAKVTPEYFNKTFLEAVVRQANDPSWHHASSLLSAAGIEIGHVFKHLFPKKK